MKRIALLAVLTCCLTGLMAQSVVLCEPFSNCWLRRSTIIGTSIGQDEETLYYYLSPRHSDSFKPKTWTEHVFFIDKNTMAKTDIPVTTPNTHTMLDAIPSEDGVIALYQSLSKKGDQAIFTIVNIDRNAKQVTLDNATTVTVPTNAKYWPEFKTAKSPDGKLLAVLVMVTGKDSQLESLSALVINNQGEIVWSGAVTPEFGGKSFSLGNLTMDNNGAIYVPAYTCQVNGKDISNVNLMMTKTTEDGTETYTEAVSFGAPQNFTAKMLKDGNIAVAGYYTESMTNTAIQTSGYYFYKFDTKSENITDLKNFTFSSNYVEKTAWARFSSVLGNQQYSISAGDIFELANGSLVFCGEHRFIKEIYDGNTHSYSYQMLTKNILVSTLLPDGTSNFTMVEKQQVSAKNTFPDGDWRPVCVSYTAFAHGNDMYFLFNDDIKNIPYPGKDAVCTFAGFGLANNWKSVLMRLTPDQKLTQRVFPETKQLLRYVDFTDGDNFYASGLRSGDIYMTKYAIEE
jgi:hypothetical protein